MGTSQLAVMDELPVPAGVAFAHVAVHAIAEAEGVDVLHIKGPAVAEQLRSPWVGDPTESPTPRQSMDADVWVRPRQVEQFLGAMEKHRWLLKVPFRDGSAFEHAATMVHPWLAPVDVHRWFPGIELDPEEAFEALWRGRGCVTVAGVECWVPSLAGQRLILLLNTARGAARHDDRSVWDEAGGREREDVEELANAVRAEVALAAATGHLDAYADRPEHDLWQLLSTGAGTPLTLWWARVRAESRPFAAIRIGFKLILPSPRRMSLAVGYQLRGKDLVQAYASRILPGIRQLRGLLDGIRLHRQRGGTR